MVKRIKNATVKRQTRIEKQIKKFQKENPEIVKSLKLFDISMLEYDKVVQSLNPIKTYTSNSTIAGSN